MSISIGSIHWKYGLSLGERRDAGALIDLGNILIKAPAPLADAEQQIDKRAYRQKQVRHEEVLGIKHIPAADKMQIAPDIIAEYARQAQQRKKNEVYCNRLLAAPGRRYPCIRQ